MQDRNASSHSRPVYLGVDVAGAKNTWVSALSAEDNGLAVVHSPHLASLEAIVGYCEESNVVAAAIGAQLTIALSEKSGFRTSDVHLRELLPFSKHKVQDLSKLQIEVRVCEKRKMMVMEDV